MSFRPLVIVAAFAAGMALAIWAPGVMTSLRPNAGAKTETDRTDSKPKVTSDGKALVPMDEERIRLAQIDQSKVGPGTIARRLSVPGTIVPDADRVAHVSVKLTGAVAELRKNIGDDVTKGEILGALESREVADAKSEYLAAKLSDELQQDLAERDRSEPTRRTVLVRAQDDLLEFARVDQLSFGRDRISESLMLWHGLLAEAARGKLGILLANGCRDIAWHELVLSDLVGA